MENPVMPDIEGNEFLVCGRSYGHKLNDALQVRDEWWLLENKLNMNGGKEM
jgi:hypothetical protein